MAHHYETVYFRPGSSGTINAIQYMPEKGWEFNWWDYEKDQYQANARLPLTGWFHVRAVVKGRTLRVYLDNAKQPAMVRDDLAAILPAGSVGFWLGNCSSGAYRNLRVQGAGDGDAGCGSAGRPGWLSRLRVGGITEMNIAVAGRRDH